MDTDDDHKRDPASQPNAAQEAQERNSSAAAADAAPSSAAAASAGFLDASLMSEEDNATLRAVMASAVINTELWPIAADDALRAAVSRFDGRNWKAIAQSAFGNGRSAVQCLHRWTKVLKPGLLKGSWSSQEDDQLRRLVAAHSTNGDSVKWTKIAEGIPGRLGKQCRERWTNHLDPQIVTGEWSTAESEILRKGYEELGPKWAKISKRLPGRTDNAVKNWYNSYIKKQVPSSPLGTTSTAAASPYAASAAAASSAAGSSTPGSVSSGSMRGGASVLSPLSMPGSVQSAAAGQRTPLVATKSKRPLAFPARPADSVHQPRALGLGLGPSAGAAGGAASYPGDPNAAAPNHYPAAAALHLSAAHAHRAPLLSPSRALGEALLTAASSVILPGRSLYSLELASLDPMHLHAAAAAAGQSFVENSPLKPESSQRHARIVKRTSRRTLARVDGLARRKNAAAAAAVAAEEAAAAAQAAASAQITAAAGHVVLSAAVPFVPHAWPHDTPIVNAPLVKSASNASAAAAAAAAPPVESQHSVVSFAATSAPPLASSQPLEDDVNASADADLLSNQWLDILTAANTEAPQTPTPNHRTGDRVPPVPATPPPSFRRYWHAPAAPGSGSSAASGGAARTAPSSGGGASANMFGRAGGLSLSPPPFDRSHTGRQALFETPCSSADKRAVKSFLVASPGSASRSPATDAALAAAAAAARTSSLVSSSSLIGVGHMRMMPIAEGGGAGSNSSFNSPSLPVTNTPSAAAAAAGAGSKRGNSSLSSSAQSSPAKQQLQPVGLTRAGSDEAMLSRDSGSTAAGGSGAGVSKRARLGPETLLHTTACSECGERVLDKLAPATPATALAHCMIGSPGCRTCAHRLNRHVHSPPEVAAEAAAPAAATAAASSLDRKPRALMATFVGMPSDDSTATSAPAAATAPASLATSLASPSVPLPRDPLFVDASRHEVGWIERKEQQDQHELRLTHEEVKRSLQQRAVSRSPSRSPLKLHNPRVAAVLLSGGKRSARDPILMRQPEGEQKQQDRSMDETEE